MSISKIVTILSLNYTTISLQLIDVFKPNKI
jgi:hypothetical protein